MKRLLCLVAAVAMFGVQSGLSAAEEVKSGLQPGDAIGAFNVTKIAGAEEDGVEIGKNLCYRCKNGGRPQVMIFTRATDEKVAALMKKLDAALEKNAEKDLKAFVNVLGDSQESATEAAKKLAKTAGTKNVPYVVPNEVENGPEDYGVNSKAEVTIIVAKKGKVEANFAAAKASDLDVDAVISGVEKVVK